MLATQTVVKLDVPGTLLPVAQLKQEAHRRAARVTGQDGLEALGILLRREDGRRDKLILDGRVVPRRAGIGRLRAPDVGLRACPRCDLVVGGERRELELQHTAGGAGRDVVEGDDRFDGVGVGAAGAGQFECRA